MTIDAFIKSLASYEGALTFNPWKDTDLRYEVENAPSIRKEQPPPLPSPRVGYGNAFPDRSGMGLPGRTLTGIAMTCERMILNEHPAVNSLMILGKEGKRTSRKDSPMIAKPTQKEKGFNEPTDSVVWKACLDAGLSADEFILWNIYPFHPHKKDDLLSNRTPTDDELAIGLSYTKELLSLTGSLPLLAIGKKSENTLLDAGFSVKGLRHPANGGANIFRNQLADFFRK